MRLYGPASNPPCCQVGRGTLKALRPEVRSDHVFWLDEDRGDSFPAAAAPAADDAAGGAAAAGPTSSAAAADAGGSRGSGALRQYLDAVTQLRVLMNRCVIPPMIPEPSWCTSM